MNWKNSSKWNHMTHRHSSELGTTCDNDIHSLQIRADVLRRGGEPFSTSTKGDNSYWESVITSLPSLPCLPIRQRTYEGNKSVPNASTHMAFPRENEYTFPTRELRQYFTHNVYCSNAVKENAVPGKCISLPRRENMSNNMIGKAQKFPEINVGISRRL